MPKRRNKGRSRKERMLESVSNQQRVEQNVDGGIQGNGGWSVGGVLASAAGLALSGLQTVTGLNLGQNCTSLLGSFDCDEYNQRRNDCINEINNSSYNNATCYTTLVDSICREFNTYDMMYFISGTIDCDELENATTTTQIATTAAQAVGAVACNVGGAMTQAASGGDGLESSLGSGTLLGLGFIGGASLGAMMSVLCRNYSGGRGGVNQSQELQDVVTHDGGPGNGDDKNPSVREQLLDGKNGDRGNPNVSLGGKNKLSKKQLARTR